MAVHDGGRGRGLIRDGARRSCGRVYEARDPSETMIDIRLGRGVLEGLMTGMPERLTEVGEARRGCGMNEAALPEDDGGLLGVGLVCPRG